jgi:hypothetical protein
VASGWLDRLLPDIHVEGHHDSYDAVDLRETLVGQRTSSGLPAESAVAERG